MENKTLLNETLESGMESLKTMKPGSEEYASSNSATTRKPKRPTGDLSTRG